MGLSRLWRRGAEKPAVKCIGCGCFYTHPALDIPERARELTKAERDRVRAGGCLPGRPYCLKRDSRFQTERENIREQQRQVTTAAELRHRPPGVDRANRQKLREKYLGEHRCDGFIKHEPGLTPKEHIQYDLERKDREKAEREHRKWEASQRIRWALLGALLTIIGQVAAAALIWYFGFRG